LYSRDLLSVTNIVFLVGGIYFVALAAAGQATIYSIIPGVFCFLSMAFAARKELIFSSPFRLGTAILVLSLTVAQEISVLSNFVASTIVAVSFVVNGVLFVLFLGVALSVARELMRVKESDEEVEEEQSARSGSKTPRQTV
jgi:hypothetical protein